jgi:hypothetical protein
MPLFESIQVDKDKVVWNGDNKLCIRLKLVIGYLCVANGTKWMGGARDGCMFWPWPHQNFQFSFYTCIYMENAK